MNNFPLQRQDARAEGGEPQQVHRLPQAQEDSGTFHSIFGSEYAN